MALLFTPRPELTSGILRLKQPEFPMFRFEWHPQVKRVYFIREGTRTAHAFAHEIENEGQARNAVYVFLRGYREALREPPIPKVEAEGKA